MNNVLRDIGSHTNISSYSTDTSAEYSSNDAGKKLFKFFPELPFFAIILIHNIFIYLYVRIYSRLLWQGPKAYTKEILVFIVNTLGKS